MRLTRQEFIAGLTTVKTIQSATWRRRVDKKVKRCCNCNTETARHNGEDYCNQCEAVVLTYQSVEATAGDIVKMQFIPRINREGTKNWSPVPDGIVFNAATQEDAERIKLCSRLIQCLKMGEQVPTNDAAELQAMIQTGDLKAVPRVIPVNDVETWTAEGQTYEIVD